MPCVVESSTELDCHEQEGDFTQVSLVRLCRISNEGTHTVLSRAL
jgi:hypothetical protein